MTYSYTAVLVRYGEIAIKSDQTRRSMVKLLVRHIKTALEKHAVQYSKVITEYGRIFILTEQAHVVASIVANVFGVVSTSPTVVTSANMDEIVQVGFEMAKSEFDSNLTFAAGARRIGTHDFTSQDLREQLGAKIHTELGMKVNLSEPDQIIYVEVRNDKAYLFTQTVEGVGGMPTGTQGKVVCIIDGRLQSLVAAFKVLKRGAIPVFLTIGQKDAIREELILRGLSKVSHFIHDFPVKSYYISPDSLSTSLSRIILGTRGMLQRSRALMNIAEEIARREKADAIVTGDIIGDSPWESLHNLRLVSSTTTSFPILRPLAGDDMKTILSIAQRLDVVSSINHETIDGVQHLPATANDLLSQTDVDIPEIDYENLVDAAVVNFLNDHNPQNQE